MRGVKHDQDKTPMGLLPGRALQEVARVFGFGAEKYSPNGWREVRPGSRYLDAALRHLTAHADGEDVDAESGLSHLAHACACVLILIGLQARGVSVRWGEDSPRCPHTWGYVPGEDLRQCGQCGQVERINGRVGEL